MNSIKPKQFLFLFIGIVSIIGLIIVVFYKPRYVYDVVILGDSNIGNVRDESSIPAIVSGNTNLTVFNGGFGGSTMSDVNEASFVNLAEAIVNQEFSRVLACTAARYDGNLTYYDQALRELSSIDFNRVKVLVIAYGTNDQLLEISPEEFREDMERGIGSIQNKYPDIKIIVVTPVYNKAEREESIEVYRDIIMEVYDDDSNIEIYDAYNSIVNEDNIEAVTVDGIHLNEEARKQYGDELSEIVNKLVTNGM